MITERGFSPARLNRRWSLILRNPIHSRHFDYLMRFVAESLKGMVGGELMLYVRYSARWRKTVAGSRRSARCKGDFEGSMH